MTSAFFPSVLLLVLCFKLVISWQLGVFQTISFTQCSSLGTPKLFLLPPLQRGREQNHVGIVVAICSALHEHLVTVATLNAGRPSALPRPPSSPINNLFGRQRGVKNLGVVTYCQRGNGRPLPLLTNVRSIPDMNIAYQGEKKKKKEMK